MAVLDYGQELIPNSRALSNSDRTTYTRRRPASTENGIDFVTTSLPLNALECDVLKWHTYRERMRALPLPSVKSGGEIWINSQAAICRAGVYEPIWVQRPPLQPKWTCCGPQGPCNEAIPFRCEPLAGRFTRGLDR